MADTCICDFDASFSAGLCDECGLPEHEVYVYPPKVVTLDDLKKFLPWAEVEAAPDGELLIYTGLQHTDQGVEAPLAYIEGMQDDG